LKWTDLSASLTEAQLEYRRVFSSRLQKSSAVDHHPVVRASLSEDRCAICGTAHAGEKIRAALMANECPLCESPIDRSIKDDGAVAELQRLDRAIADVRNNLATILETRERVNAEVIAAHAREDASISALTAFEEKEAQGLARAGVGSDFSTINEQLKKLENERLQFLSHANSTTANGMNSGKNSGYMSGSSRRSTRSVHGISSLDLENSPRPSSVSLSTLNSSTAKARTIPASGCDCGWTISCEPSRTRCRKASVSLSTLHSAWRCPSSWRLARPHC
jgi:hypothetical protein